MQSIKSFNKTQPIYPFKYQNENMNMTAIKINYMYIFLIDEWLRFRWFRGCISGLTKFIENWFVFSSFYFLYWYISCLICYLPQWPLHLFMAWYINVDYIFGVFRKRLLNKRKKKIYPNYKTWIYFVCIVCICILSVYLSICFLCMYVCVSSP